MALTTSRKAVDFITLHAHPTALSHEHAANNEWLKVEALPGKGRGFIARRPIPAGTTVYTAQPLAVAVSQEWIPETCAWCFAFSYPKKMRVKSTHTKSIMFCSSECQTCFYQQGCKDEAELLIRSFYALEHVKESTATATASDPLADIIPPPPSKDCSDTRLAGWLDEAWSIVAAAYNDMNGTWVPERGERTMCRLIVACLARKQCQEKCLLTSTPDMIGFEQLWEMQCNELACVRAMLQTEQEVPMQLIEIMHLYLYLSSALAGILDCPHALFRAIYFREAANSFGLWEMPHGNQDIQMMDQGVTDDQELLGWGIYPSAVYFNHACNANIAKIRDGRNMRFIAKTDIAANQEACISYGSVGETVQERRARLLEHYHFWCECIRCKAESSSS